MAPLGIDVSRGHVVDFTKPFFFEYTTVMAKLPNPNKTKWQLYLRPFKVPSYLHRTVLTVMKILCKCRLRVTVQRELHGSRKHN